MGFLDLQNKAENLQEWKLEDQLHWLESSHKASGVAHV